jgi:hypothetical protein
VAIYTQILVISEIKTLDSTSVGYFSSKTASFWYNCAS